MAQIITVPVEDLHPRPNARALDAGLVTDLTQSMCVIGFSPAKPVVVRKDGGMYWIVDGGHRVAAARAAGITEIPAEVEDIDEAGVLTREGALNLQRPDTEEERWTRAQEFFLLGDVSPEAVEIATGIKAEAQPKLRSVLKKLNDETAAEDVSLEQAMAAHEFLGDDEAFAAIMNAGTNWRGKFYSLTTARKFRTERDRLMAIIEAVGVEVVEAGQYGMVDSSVWHYCGRGDDKPEGATGARVEGNENSGYAHVIWYEPAGEDKAAAERAAAAEARDAHQSSIKAAASIRREFVLAYLSGESDSLSNALRDFAVSAWEDGITAEVGAIDPEDEFNSIQSWGALKGFNSRVYASILAEIDTHIPFASVDYYRNLYAAQSVAYFAALTECGYEPSAVEEQELNLLVEWLAARDTEEADDED